MLGEDPCSRRSVRGDGYWHHEGIILRGRWRAFGTLNPIQVAQKVMDETDHVLLVELRAAHLGSTIFFCF